MEFFEGHTPEQPCSLDFSAGGRAAVADRGGRRVAFGLLNERPHLFEGAPALRCRFAGETLALLGADGLLRTFREDGSAIGEMPTRPGAVNLAVAASGSPLLSFGRGAGGVTLERLGDRPALHRDPELLDAAVLAVESGGVWIAGTAAAAPLARAVRLRPAAEGFRLLDTIALSVPPRAATIGPDGALFLLLEPGESVVRLFGGVLGEVARLDQPATELARAPGKLWACGPRGLFDLTHLVPVPEDDGPEFTLPSCET